MTQNKNDTPADIPEEVAETLRGRSDRELRKIIQYTQQLLRERPNRTDAIEPREGEELIRTADHGAYTIVVVERPEESGEAAGPFAYRVRWEPVIDGEGGTYRWHYLGRVDAESGGG